MHLRPIGLGAALKMRDFSLLEDWDRRSRGCAGFPIMTSFVDRPIPGLGTWEQALLNLGDQLFFVWIVDRWVSDFIYSGRRCRVGKCEKMPLQYFPCPDSPSLDFGRSSLCSRR